MSKSIKPIIPLEKEILKDVIKYLMSLKIGTVLRHSTGVFNTGNRFISAGKPGTSDLSLELHNSPITIWIEIKRNITSSKPTPEQIEFIARQNQRGNIAFIARSVNDVKEILIKNNLIK